MGPTTDSPTLQAGVQPTTASPRLFNWTMAFLPGRLRPSSIRASARDSAFPGGARLEWGQQRIHQLCKLEFSRQRRHLGFSIGQWLSCLAGSALHQSGFRRGIRRSLGAPGLNGANNGFTNSPSWSSADNGVTSAFQWDIGFPAWQAPPFINPGFGAGFSVPWWGAEE